MPRPFHITWDPSRIRSLVYRLISDIFGRMDPNGNFVDLTCYGQDIDAFTNDFLHEIYVGGSIPEGGMKVEIPEKVIKEIEKRIEARIMKTIEAKILGMVSEEVTSQRMYGRKSALREGAPLNSLFG